MTDLDYRESARLTFDRELNWVNFPESFPYKEFADRKQWAGEMASMVYWVGRGKHDGSQLEKRWFLRTARIIDGAHENFVGDEARYRFLLFHDVDAIPTAISVNTFIANVPWEEVRPLYTGEQHKNIVEGPYTEAFDMDATEVAVRSLRYHYLDEADRTLSGHYHYAFRRDGMDVVVRATFIDLGTLREGVPVLDRFVRGIGITFGD